MRKKIFKALATAFAVLSFASLALPLYDTYIGGTAVSAQITIRGLNLAEFSPWGGIIVLSPLLSAGAMYSKLTNNAKTLLLFAIGLLNAGCLCPANQAAKYWIYTQATGAVTDMPYLVLYASSLLVSLILFYLHCNCSDK